MLNPGAKVWRFHSWAQPWSEAAMQRRIAAVLRGWAFRWFTTFLLRTGRIEWNCGKASSSKGRVGDHGHHGGCLWRLVLFLSNPRRREVGRLYRQDIVRLHSSFRLPSHPAGVPEVYAVS